MLDEAPVVDLLHFRVLKWSKIMAGRTEDLSSAAHRRFDTEGCPMRAALTEQLSRP